jgi:WxcM-like, C-terminal
VNDHLIRASGKQLSRSALNDVDDVRLIELPRFARDDGAVVVAETGAAVPFTVARIFTVTAPAGAHRGNHAHRLCTQLMFCAHGIVEVICDDGRMRQSFVLDRGNLALCVPPTIWNTIVYREAGSVLTVLCDRPFEESDYLRTYDAFVAYRKEKS